MHTVLPKTPPGQPSPPHQRHQINVSILGSHHRHMGTEEAPRALAVGWLGRQGHRAVPHMRHRIMSMSECDLRAFSPKTRLQRRTGAV